MTETTNPNHYGTAGHRAALTSGLPFALVVPTTGEVLGRYGDRPAALEALDASTSTSLVLVLEVARHLEAVAA